MASETASASFPVRPVRDSASRGDGALCLANCTTESFILVRAKGSGKLRTAALLAGTEPSDGGGFAYRLCEPGWRQTLCPGQELALTARSGPCAGVALFSLQDAAGKAMASLTYTMVPEPGDGPARGQLTLEVQGPGARALQLATAGSLPGNVFLVRESQLGALRQALEEYDREHPAGPGSLSPVVGA